MFLFRRHEIQPSELYTKEDAKRIHEAYMQLFAALHQSQHNPHSPHYLFNLVPKIPGFSHLSHWMNKLDKFANEQENNGDD